MATTGSVTIDLNNFGDMINNSAGVGEQVTQGVAEQGSLIGLSIGLTLAIGLLFGVIVLLLAFVVTLVRKTKGIKHA